ncbi:MAG: cation-translocating P-type ATPase [Candidatus Bipolaricaulota bacterium]
MPEIQKKAVWHTLAASETAQALETDAGAGLTAGEAAARLAAYGPNALPESPPTPFWRRLVGQLRGFVVLILIAAAVISTVVYFIEPEPLGWLDSVVIVAIIVLNAFVGALQDSRAEKALQSLKQMAAPEAQVLRDGQRTTVRARDLVPGDVVLLEAGTIVPADLRLVESPQMRVDESSLTGESVPVEKHAEASLAAATGIADRSNCAFLGTTVVYGRGRGIVVGTGADTQLGEIAEMIEEQQEETPLQRKLEEFGRILGTIILVVCAIVFVLEIVRDPNVHLIWDEGLGAYLRTGAGDLIRFFMVAVSLAVAAVPEGLPAIVTMCLALGTREMLRRHALVRRLPSVETLGSATVICTDKTGTLTQNQMTVTSVWAGRETFDVTGRGYDPSGEFTRSGGARASADHPVLRRALWAAALCNDAELRNDAKGWRVVGDPTEGALVVAAAKGGVMRETAAAASPRVTEIPFDSDRKRMTTVHKAVGTPFEGDGRHVALVKGAPDVLLGLCARIEGPGGPTSMDAAARAETQRANDAMASQGLRVLAVAYRAFDALPDEVRPETAEHDLALLGLLGMQDPPRPEVADAIDKAREAGLRTIMITGDHVATAEAIAHQIGLLRPDGRVVSGAEMDKMAEGQLAREIDGIDVFARVSPHHKVEIVEALRSNGEVVAMTGDGVNDAPALKRADIGVAMGIAGTDVAKNTADMVLTDDNYASIVAAVEQGRIIYSNIRKTVYYLLSCNFAEVAIIFGAILIGWPAPLTAIQLLWLNLLTDGAPALALGLEHGEPDIMSRRPRSPRERIINRDMARGILYQAGALTAAVLGVYALGLYAQGALHEDAMTIAFTTLVLAELVRAYTARSENVPLYRIGFFTNRAMQWAVLVSLVLLAAVLYVPGLQKAFDTKTLPGSLWIYIAPLAFVPALVVEIRKIVLSWRGGRAKSA